MFHGTTPLEFSGWMVRALARSSGGSWFESTHSITKMWLVELPPCLTVRFHLLGWIEVGQLPHSGQGWVIMRKLRLECCISHWMPGRGAHTKNIPSHSIFVYHPYTWEHYSQYNNKYNINIKKRQIKLPYRPNPV